MKKMYEAPVSVETYFKAQDVITSSIDSAEDGFDGDIVDLSPVG